MPWLAVTNLQKCFITTLSMPLGYNHQINNLMDKRGENQLMINYNILC